MGWSEPESKHESAKHKKKKKKVVPFGELHANPGPPGVKVGNADEPDDAGLVAIHHDVGAGPELLALMIGCHSGRGIGRGRRRRRASRPPACGGNAHLAVSGVTAVNSNRNHEPGER